MDGTMRSGLFTPGHPAAATTPGAGWGWILGYGVLSAAIGVASFLWPFAATLAATLVVGSFFAATGLVSVVAGITGKGHEGRGYAIAFGIFSLVLGLILMLEPATGALSLTLLATVWLAIRGGLEIGWGARMRGAKWSMIAMGTVNLLLAVYVFLTLPASAFIVPGYALGISFLLGGIGAIAAALAHRRGDPAFALPR